MYGTVTTRIYLTEAKPFSHNYPTNPRSLFTSPAEYLARTTIRDMNLLLCSTILDKFQIYHLPICHNHVIIHPIMIVRNVTVPSHQYCHRYA